MKTSVPNPAYDRTIAILREAGYYRLRSFTASDSTQRGVLQAELGFEVWGGRKGVIIVQQWSQGNGAAVYAGWTLGHTDDDLRSAL